MAIDRFKRRVPEVTGSIEREQGALMLLAALILAALCMVIAFSIDAGRVIAATEEKRNFADAVALAALEIYYSCDPSSPGNPENPCRNSAALPTGYVAPTLPAPGAPEYNHVYKFNRAIDRAYQIGMQNFGTFTGDNTGMFLNAGAINTATGFPAVTPVTAPLLSSEEGRIRSGRWWPVLPPGTSCGASTECPCGTGSNAAPCFQTCSETEGCPNPDGTYTMPDSRLANAFQVYLNTPQTSGRGVKRIFSSVFGATGDMEAGGNSTAGGGVSTGFAIPKFGVLLVDLSRSMASDNYIPENSPYAGGTAINTAGGIVMPRKAEFAYRLTGACGTTEAMNLSIDPVNYQTSFTGVPMTDYTCVTSTEQVGATGPSASHSLMVYSGGNPQYVPQPFSSLAAAVGRFIKTFRDGASPLDRLVVVGFYQDLNSPTGELKVKILPSTSTVLPAPFTGISDAAGMLALETMFDPATGEAARQAAGFVPQSFTASDIPGALRLAEELLRKGVADDNKLWASVDPFITIFTAGLTSVNRGQNGAGVKVARQAIAVSPAPADPAFIAHRDSLIETQFIAEKRLKANGIRLNIVMAGANSGAHIPLVTDYNVTTLADKGICATDRSLRALNAISWLALDPEASNLAAYSQSFYDLEKQVPTNSYLQPGDFLYYAAVNTGGWFLPIKPPCSTVNAASLTAICDGRAPVTGVAQPTASWTHWERTQLMTIKPPALPLISPTEIDADGRLYCDPTIPVGDPDSISEMGKQVMGSRPITLVN